MNRTERSPEPTQTARVVVVDDNDAVRDMFALGFNIAGYTAIPAQSELELQRELAQGRPDALVIDLQRSETDGLDLLSRVRARQNLRHMPIVFLSGRDADDLRDEALARGADLFALRPIGVIELTNRLAELMQSGRQRRKREAHILRLRRTG